jgi:hypothetical protein
MIPDNAFIGLGLGACFIVLGIMLAVVWRERERKRRKKFDVEAPF